MIKFCGICGDVIGSVYEFAATRKKSKDFELFLNSSKYTDDTVCTIAIMKWLLCNREIPLEYIMRDTCLKDINRGYGTMFYNWLKDSTMKSYNSFGNGSAMRASAIAWYAKSMEEAMEIAEESAKITHDHEEGIKGAKAIVACTYLAKIGKTKEEIEDYIRVNFESYDLNQTVDEIRQTYKFDATCQGSVPQSIICFLESKSFEDSIRNAISLGGDTDTMAAMASSIAEAYYREIPTFIQEMTIMRLPNEYIDVLIKFSKMIEERNKEKNQTLIVNLYGGPGSGKSTTCAGVFERLKLEGINCEMATEYAKDKVWEESYKTLDDQIYVFGKQLHRLKRLIGKVDVVITDSPLLFSIQYDSEKNEAFKTLVIDQYSRMNNLNFFIIRNSHFESKGRMQNLEESKEIDKSIKDILNSLNIDYTFVEKVKEKEDGSKLYASEVISKLIIEKLKEL